ncbi:hypothetical protein ACFLZ6_02540, partial [Nanoarchaeota archaeon]
VLFYSWFQAFGGRSRAFILFFPVTAIFAAYGILLSSKLLTHKYRKASKFVLIVISIVLAVMFVPYSIDSGEPFTLYENTSIFSEWLARNDQEITRDMRLPVKDEFILETKIPGLVKN